MSRLPTKPSDKKAERNRKMIFLALYTLFGIAIVCAILLIVLQQ